MISKILMVLSLANHRQFAKLSHSQTFPLYGRLNSQERHIKTNLCTCPLCFMSKKTKVPMLQLQAKH